MKSILRPARNFCLFAFIVIFLHCCILAGTVSNIPLFGPRLLGLNLDKKELDPINEAPILVYTAIGIKILEIRKIRKPIFDFYMNLLRELGKIRKSHRHRDFSIAGYFFNFKFLNLLVLGSLVSTIILTIIINFTRDIKKQKE